MSIQVKNRWKVLRHEISCLDWLVVAFDCFEHHVFSELQAVLVFAQKSLRFAFVGHALFKLRAALVSAQESLPLVCVRHAFSGRLTGSVLAQVLQQQPLLVFFYQQLFVFEIEVHALLLFQTIYDVAHVHVLEQLAWHARFSSLDIFGRKKNVIFFV